jgi:hypothetical protein
MTKLPPVDEDHARDWIFEYSEAKRMAPYRANVILEKALLDTQPAPPDEDVSVNLGSDFANGEAGRERGGREEWSRGRDGGMEVSTMAGRVRRRDRSLRFGVWRMCSSHRERRSWLASADIDWAPTRS